MSYSIIGLGATTEECPEGKQRACVCLPDDPYSREPRSTGFGFGSDPQCEEGYHLECFCEDKKSPTPSNPPYWDEPRSTDWMGSGESSGSGASTGGGGSGSVSRGATRVVPQIESSSGITTPVIAAGAAVALLALYALLA